MRWTPGSPPGVMATARLAYFSFSTVVVCSMVSRRPHGCAEKFLLALVDRLVASVLAHLVPKRIGEGIDWFGIGAVLHVEKLRRVGVVAV